MKNFLITLFVHDLAYLDNEFINDIFILNIQKDRWQSQIRLHQDFNP